MQCIVRASCNRVFIFSNALSDSSSPVACCSKFYVHFENHLFISNLQFMKTSSLFILYLMIFFSFSLDAQNAPPVITSILVQFESSTNELVVYYNLQDTENDNIDITFLLSDDGGATYLTEPANATGHVGFPIAPGTGKQIRWNIGSINDIFNYSVRLVANDRQTPGIETLVAQVDSNRLLTDLQMIEGTRHYQANPTHLEEIKDTIEDRFERAGLQTRRQDVVAGGYTGHNIIGRLPGLGNEAITYIIDGHFDTVDDAPGADDNGSAVAGVLEALRILAPHNFEKSITFIGFDFEEAVGLFGLNGSRDYVQSGRLPYETVEGVINFEMIGYYSNEVNTQTLPTGFGTLFPTATATVTADSFRGNFITNVGDTESEMLWGAYDTAIARYVPNLKSVSLLVSGDGLLTPDLRRSDHAPFWDDDVPALMLTDGANFRNPNYHTPNDTSGSLNYTFMSRVVAASIATIAELAGWQNSTYKDASIFPAGIEGIQSSCTIEVSPNPSEGELTIQIGSCFRKATTLSLYAMDSKLILKRQENQTNSEITLILPPDLQNGLYFIILNNGRVAGSERVVLNRK